LIKIENGSGALFFQKWKTEDELYINSFEKIKKLPVERY